uniref:Uncharacterized protein n=1 Tax=Timema monikensis TaxID=170555 RepID=A0A7R9EE26_9NEOP|nr:unnamed protein product [Timema monikensis]
MDPSGYNEHTSKYLIFSQQERSTSWKGPGRITARLNGPVVAVSDKGGPVRITEWAPVLITFPEMKDCGGIFSFNSAVYTTACIYCYAAVVITPTVNVGLLLPGIYGAQYAVKDRYPPSAIMIIFPTTLMWLHISQFDVRRLGVPCPRNYNPSDYFIELLAVIPTREETCKQTIELICDNFKNSEIGLKIHHDTEPRTDLQVSYSHLDTLCCNLPIQQRQLHFRLPAGIDSEGAA